MSASAGKRTASKNAAVDTDKEKKQRTAASKAPVPVVAVPSSECCEEAFYHAAFCGRGPYGGNNVPPNASDLNFQGVLKYLATAPPIDYQLIPGINCERDWENYSFAVATMRGFPLSLLAAAVASEWDSVDSRGSVAKRAIFEMVLLAGATFDDNIRKFAGSNVTDPGGGVTFSGDYVCAVLDICTATPAVRLARWPGVLAEIRAAKSGAAQYAVTHTRFLEICCEGKVDEATLDGVLTFFDKGGFVPGKSRTPGLWALAVKAMQKQTE